MTSSPRTTTVYSYIHAEDADEINVRFYAAGTDSDHTPYWAVDFDGRTTLYLYEESFERLIQALHEAKEEACKHRK